MRAVALALLVLTAASAAHAQNWQPTYRNIYYDPESIQYVPSRDALVVMKRFTPAGMAPVDRLQLVLCARPERRELLNPSTNEWTEWRPVYPEDLQLYRDRMCALGRNGTAPIYGGLLPPA